MPILAYCVSLAQEYLNAPIVGVAEGTVYDLEDRGLRVWYSEVEEGTFSGADHVTRAALDFHRFVSAVFREGAVLPFRFPTILESVEDLQGHLEEKAQWYTKTLQQTEALAQFEARVLIKEKPSPEAGSGTEYLEKRKQIHERSTQAVAGLLDGLDDFLRDHHVKESQQGTRVYLLVERLRSSQFRDAAGRLEIPEGIEIRLTGPWPPTEFLPTTEDEL